MAHYSSFTVQNNDLFSSWILDSGSDIHVCNQSMAHRFQETSKALPQETLKSGDQILSIQAWGTLDITVQTRTGPETLTLTRVAFVPSFMANLVSLDIAISKHFEWDTKNMQLLFYEEHFCFVERNNGHFLLENNINSNHQVFPAVSASTRKVSAEKWHQTLAHANPEVIQHLQANSEGVIVTQDSPAPSTTQCQACALAKAHKIISRSSSKEEDSTEPFFRLSYDLLQLQPAYNQDKWVSHFACLKTGFTFIFTHQDKSEAQEIVQFVIKLIKTRYKRTVTFFRTDGERTLGNETKSFLVDQGITLETSAPGTSEQNGHAERLGGVILNKARAMRIAANLPESLWPEVIKSAGYLYNRTPQPRLNWMTPFQAITGNKPDLSHLRVFGCRAYALKRGIPRTQKLAERAHLGHLIGYDSTNIFRIWLPSQGKIIRTRDVKFNEDQSYNPRDPDLTQLLQEEATELIQTLNIPERIDLPQLEEDSDEDTIVIRIPTQPTNHASEHQSEQSNENHQYLPTPEPSVDTDDLHGQPHEIQESESQTEEHLSSLPPLLPAQYDTPVQAGAEQGNRAPQATRISGRISQDNILPKGVNNQRSTRSTRKQAYSAALAETNQGSNSSYFSAFAAALNITKDPSTKPSTPHRDQLPPEPTTFKQMLKHPHAPGFIQALKFELRTLIKVGTWITVQRSKATQANKKVIPLTWVFKYKFDTEGYLIKYKARLCVRGDLQVTEQDTYAATLAAKTFRALSALMAAFDLESRQYDAVNAFVNSPIDEDTFCELPEGFYLLEELQDLQSGLILQLLRALYGLKQSPALWHNHLSSTLHDLGLTQVPGVNCLFINAHMILFFFVDDIAVIFTKENTRQVEEFQQHLLDTYELRVIGELEWFLAIRIIRDRLQRKLWLCQDSYIDKLANKFNIKDEKYPQSPLPQEEIQPSDTQATDQEIHAYQQRIGSINFAASFTRPDVAQAASKLAEYLQNPSSRHLQLATRVIHYLVGTKHLAIEYNGFCTNQQSIFLACSDASFANDQQTRKSSQGYVFQLFNGPVDWKATKQKTVTTSSTEAEFLSLSDTARELLYWERLFQQIRFNPDHHLFIQCDNTQTIRLLDESSPKLATRLRHVDIHQHWLRQEIQNQRIRLQWTPSAEMVADGLTKPLPPQRFKLFVQQLNLTSIQSLLT